MGTMSDLDRQIHVFAPGRTEIAGNHTDHEGGHVIAATISQGIHAIASPRSDETVRVVSEGFEPVVIDLLEQDALSPHSSEFVTTTALARGMVAQLVAAGVEVHGFDVHMVSDLPAGGGLSSSAAFELAIGVIVRELFAREAGSYNSGGSGIGFDAFALARMAQRAEIDFFGKPCGLMDQLSIALGGVCAIDFFDQAHPQASSIDFNFTSAGYTACLVDVGCDHSRFTSEYAAVPQEMHEVARLFGADRLVDVVESDVLSHASFIRTKLGDRALLRAMHFYREERLTAIRKQALEHGDIQAFLQATRASGASSAELLQNVFVPGTDEPAMVALALAQEVLAGKGACRIHGGGFGGSIQAFVPTDMLNQFIARMQEWLGTDCCTVLALGGAGAGIDTGNT